MKKLIDILISVSLVMILVVRRGLEPPLHWDMLLGSLLPPLEILWGWNRARFTVREIRYQKFRLTVYGLSVIVFLLCLLPCVGILPTAGVDGSLTKVQVAAVKGMVFLIIGLVVANLVISHRDNTRREEKRPL